jgi:hypothetical protein
MKRSLLPTVLLAACLLAACDAAPSGATCPGPDCPGCPGPDCGPTQAQKADDYVNQQGANPAAGGLVLYEVQVRAANACRADTGSQAQRQACAARVAPAVSYHAEGLSCDELDYLQDIRLGTLDDLLEEFTDQRQGITLRYIKQRVGANTVWLMPLFPNNDAWSIPAACDNLGSPYAVRDYLHAAGTLSAACVEAGRDEYSDSPCWGNDTLDQVIREAHRLGLRVMLDVAFNHFGHNYRMYDYVDYTPTRALLEAGEDLDRLWDFEATQEPALLQPELLERESQLEELTARDVAAADDLATLDQRCPGLSGDERVRAFAM